MWIKNRRMNFTVMCLVKIICCSHALSKGRAKTHQFELFLKKETTFVPNLQVSLKLHLPCSGFSLLDDV